VAIQAGRSHRALGVEGWCANRTRWRGFRWFDPAFMDWYAKKSAGRHRGRHRLVDFAGSVDAKPYLQRIADRSSRSTRPQQYLVADQEAALREHIASVKIVHLDTPYAMLGMLQRGLRRSDPQFRRGP